MTAKISVPTTMRDVLWAPATGLFAILALVVGLAYWSTLSHEFVYDDHRFVAENPAVREGVGFLTALRDPQTLSVEQSVGGAYRPLRTWIWGVVAQRFETGAALEASSFRLLNILGHMLAVFLLGLLAHRVGLATWAAAGGALFFGLHPMATESVIWVSSLGDVLALDGVLLALFVFLMRPRLLLALPLLFLFTSIALLAKEMAVTIPLLLAVLVWGEQQGGIRARKWELAAASITVLAYFVLRSTVLREVGLDQNSRPVAEALWDMGQGLAYYAAAFCLVLAPRFDWNWSQTWWVCAVFGWSLFGAGGIGLLWAAHRRAWKFGVGTQFTWIGLLALLPVLQLVPLNIVAADRFFYPSLAFLSLALVHAISKYCPPKLGFACLALLLSLALARLLLVQPQWQDERHLWESVVEREDRAGAPSSRARYNLGRALMAGIDQNQSDDSVRDGRRSYSLIRKTWSGNFGGRAVLVKAATYADEPAAVIAAGGALFDDWIAGRADAEPNLDAIIEWMHRAAQKIGLRANLAQPNAETLSAADSLDRPQSFLGHMRVHDKTGPARLAEFLKIRGFLRNLAGRQVLALSDFRYFLQDLEIDDLDVRTWRVSILANIVGEDRKDEVLAEYLMILRQLSEPHLERLKNERASFLQRLEREKNR